MHGFECAGHTPNRFFIGNRSHERGALSRFLPVRLYISKDAQQIQMDAESGKHGICARRWVMARVSFFSGRERLSNQYKAKDGHKSLIKSVSDSKF